MSKAITHPPPHVIPRPLPYHQRNEVENVDQVLSVGFSIQGVSGTVHKPKKKKRIKDHGFHFPKFQN